MNDYWAIVVGNDVKEIVPSDELKNSGLAYYWKPERSAFAIPADSRDFGKWSNGMNLKAFPVIKNGEVKCWEIL